jgi:hypothetical protein
VSRRGSAPLSPSPARRSGTGSPGPLDLRSEEGGCFSQDLALGLEDVHPPAEFGERGPLVKRERRSRRALAGQADPLARLSFEMPSSMATWRIDWPEVSASRTASARNSAL